MRRPLLACLLVISVVACETEDRSPEPGLDPGFSGQQAGAPSDGELLEVRDGVSIFHRAVGDGPLILALHGGPGLDHRYLTPGLDVLADERKVVYFDQRGLGRSRAEVDTATISVRAVMDDIEALADHYDADRFTLLAHSWGGLLGMLYALERPERLEGLILVGTVEPGSRFQEAAAERLAGRQDAATRERLDALMASEELRARDPEAIEELFHLMFRATVSDPAVLDRMSFRIHEATAREGGRVGQLVMDSVGREDWWDELEALGVPTLIIHGELDPSPPEMVERLVATIPTARLEMMEGVGHFPFVEAPEAFARAVDDFLQGLGGG